MTDDPRLDAGGQDPFERAPLPPSDGRRAPVRTSDQDTAALSGRCESCGGSIESGTLCPGCEHAFQRELANDSPIDLQAISTSQLDELFAAIEEAQARPKPAAEPASAVAPEPAAPAAFSTSHAATQTTAHHYATDVDASIVAIPQIAMPRLEPFVMTRDAVETEPQYTPIALKPQPEPAAPPPAAAAGPHIHAASASITAEKAVAAPEPVAARAQAADETVEAATVAASAEDTQKPAASARPRAAAGGLKRIATAAAAVIVVAAIGLPLTKLWLGRPQTIVTQKPAAAAAKPAPQPVAKSATQAKASVATPAVKPAAVAASKGASKSARVPLVPGPGASRVPEGPGVPRVPGGPVAKSAPAAAPETRTVAARPKPAPAPPAPQRAAVSAPAAAASRPTAKPPVRPVKAAPAPAVAAVAPAVESAAVALPEITEVAAAVAPPAPAVPESPVGPFYESTDVDKTPQVLSRVEPLLSPELMSRAAGEIVVVRFLVTQTGRPVLVSLLRHSKAGMDLDEAVIAAIKAWRFAPAMKRGRAVSCFVHLGVPIGR